MALCWICVRPLKQWQCISQGHQGRVLLTLLRHVARILANGSAAFFESCDTIGWNSCDVSQNVSNTGHSGRFCAHLHVIFLVATKQLYEWSCLSVTPIWLCSHHRIITKFSGVFTNDKSDVHAKSRGHPSNYEMMNKAWSSIEEVPYCFSRSSVKFQGHTALKIVEFDPNWAFPDCNSSLNSPMAPKWCTNLEVA